MPIEVHCPNPICARVHVVKNRYAGMRGRCPSCKAWMYVPRATGSASRAEVPVVDPDDAMPWTAEKPVARAAVPMAEDPESESFPLGGPAAAAKTAPRKSAKQVAVDEDPGATDEGAEQPKRLGYLPVLLLFLGLLGLGAVAAAPFLEKPKYAPSGVFVTETAPIRPTGIDDEKATYVMGAAGGVAGVVLLILLIGKFTGRFGGFAVLLLWLSTLASAGLLFVMLNSYHKNTDALAALMKLVEERKAAGAAGDVSADQGQQLYALAGGSALASGGLLLAALVIHRRWWARLLAFVTLGGAIALACVWVYRVELGVEEFLPPDLDKMIPF